jgi:hypothetical protein
MSVLPDEDTSSHILAVFHLASVQGWVYLAIMDELGANVEHDVQTLVDKAAAVERVDTSVLWDNTEGKALDLGLKTPYIIPIVGEEFLQTLVCLSQSRPTYHLPDDSSVGVYLIPFHLANGSVSAALALTSEMWVVLLGYMTLRPLTSTRSFS